MHNIKDIRNNFENFKNKIKSRNISIDLDQILQLDQNNRKLIQEKESLEQEKKSISKKQDKSLFIKSKEISEKITSINKDQSLIKNKLNNLLSSIPNLPLKDVPVGVDENANKEGISVEAYQEKLEKDGNYFDLMPDVIKQGVYEKIGGESKRKDYTDAQLHEKAAHVQRRAKDRRTF